MHFPIARLRWITLFAGLVLLVTAVEVGVVHSAAFGRRPDWVALGVTFDLVVGLPVLYYFLIVRRLKIPPRSLLLVISLALGLTALILPVGQLRLVGVLRWLLTGAEIGFVGYLLLRAGQIWRHYRQLNVTNPDFTNNLLQSLDTVTGPSRFNRILVSELSVLRYGLLGWWLPVEKTATDTVFTSHRESGQPAFTGALIMVGLIETLAMHVWLHRWQTTVAWVVTAAGVYGLLFFVADLVATVKRPVLLRVNALVLRFGLRGYGTIDTRLIERVTAINDKPERDKQTLNGAFLTTPNVLITLREPVSMTGPLGRRRSVTRITLFLDDKNRFIHQLTA